MKLDARTFSAALLSISFSTSLLAQVPKAVTVPVTLDHNRIVIDVYIPLKDGTTKRVRGLVDTGSTKLMVSQHVVKLVGASSLCENNLCTAPPPDEIQIGGFKVPLTGLGRAVMPARDEAVADVMIPGMSPELLIPSTVLKNYDIVVDYANRQFTMAPAGSLKFTGVPTPIKVANDGLIMLSTKIDGRTFNTAFDTGLSASLTSPSQFDEWRKHNPQWPFAPGVLGAENMTGGADESTRQMLRLPGLQFGTITLAGVLAASGVEREGSSFTVGGEAFKGTRVGIDYAHSTLYIDRIQTSPATAGLDVVGLTLRPEVNGRYSVIAMVPYDGQPSVTDVKVGDALIGVDGAPVTGATMGQVWSLLGGEPGQTRKLIIERDGKRLPVEATVRRFLAAKPN
jgi:hypothetical protein